MTISRRPRDFCMDVDGASTCGLGFTVGMGWSLLLYAQSPAALGGALDCLSLAMLAFPAGFWARSDGERFGVALILGAGLLLASLAPALLPVPPTQIAAVAGGLLAGSGLAAWPALRPGPARPETGPG